MSKESIERLRAKQGGYRGVVTKLVKEAQELLQSSEIDIQVIQRCEIISGQLETRMNILNGINEEILGLCEVSEIGDEIEEAAVVLDRILNVKGKIEAAKKAGDVSITTSPITSVDSQVEDNLNTDENPGNPASNSDSNVVNGTVLNTNTASTSHAEAGYTDTSANLPFTSPPH